jgi:hypothetical protein
VVNGCHHEEVCNDGLSPNLDRFADRFMRTAFTTNGQGETFLSRSNSKEMAQLGVGIQPDKYVWAADYDLQQFVQIEPDEDGDYKLGKNQEYRGKEFNIDNSFETKGEPIESITFVGYSRGAVTCFNAARAKEELGIKVPLRIIADQPVPGSLYALPGSNAASIADCSKLKYVSSVDLSIGAYTGSVDTPGVFGQLKKLFHRLFFSQVIPILPKNTDVNLSVIPRVHHWKGGLTGDQHVHMNLTKRLADSGLLSQETANEKHNKVVYCYRENTPIFPGSEEMQGIFGSNVAHMYQNVDKNYLKNLDPEQYEGFLYKWWQAQETQASIFSTQITKDLFSLLKTPNPEDSNQKLLKIIEKADEWLLMKSGLGSSRYQQVMNLRENARERLLEKCDDVEKMKEHLHNVSRNLMHSTHYFSRQWEMGSYSASWFKTDTTLELDQAFKEHDSAKAPSFENDEKLMVAINKWLEAKQPLSEGAESPSSRYELVSRMKVQLDKIMEQYPREELTSSNQFAM